ncbi:unnamed protein product [Owenia fusiformis]|uniref:RRM domain-containing protein n=1 Tax=Owenia fusiformis TaxID=6347 RepID=A0A8S4P307_OWEFU|nr:unnamed protein product [Owenia fusiformis]
MGCGSSTPDTNGGRKSPSKQSSTDLTTQRMVQSNTAIKQPSQAKEHVQEDDTNGADEENQVNNEHPGKVHTQDIEPCDLDMSKSVEVNKVIQNEEPDNEPNSCQLYNMVDHADNAISNQSIQINTADEPSTTAYEHPSCDDAKQSESKSSIVNEISNIHDSSKTNTVELKSNRTILPHLRSHGSCRSMNAVKTERAKMILLPIDKKHIINDNSNTPTSHTNSNDQLKLEKAEVPVEDTNTKSIEHLDKLETTSTTPPTGGSDAETIIVNDTTQEELNTNQSNDTVKEEPNTNDNTKDELNTNNSNDTTEEDMNTNQSNDATGEESKTNQSNDTIKEELNTIDTTKDELNTNNSNDTGEELKAIAKRQQDFASGNRLISELVNAEELLKLANKDVRRLTLLRAPPYRLKLKDLLKKLEYLTELDLSGNSMGPQGFRAIMFALCNNSTLTHLNIAGNQTDTDSAASIGKMLSCNNSLMYLDISGNSLGKDFLSRSVASGLKVNTSLQVFKLQSCGSSDLTAMLESLVENTSLQHLDISSNALVDGTKSGRLIAEIILSKASRLCTLEMRSCGITAEGMSHIGEALKHNETLSLVNMGSNQGSSLASLMDTLCVCLEHSKLQTVHLDDMKCTDASPWKPVSEKCSGLSCVETLGLSNCGLNDDVMKTFSTWMGNSLSKLRELNLSNNPELTETSLASWRATGTSLEKLQWGLNNGAKIQPILESSFTKLKELNIRKCKMSPLDVSTLTPIVRGEKIQMLNLDGIKLSGSDALSALLGKGCNLHSLSLAGCALNDNDLAPVSHALKSGVPLFTIKMSANRISDVGVILLVEGLKTSQSQTLELLDLANNKIEDDGCVQLAEFFKSQSQCKIHTLLLNSNAIGSVGVKALVECLHKDTSLTILQLSNQRASFEEEEIEELFEALRVTLGYEAIGEDSLCTLPYLKHGLQLQLLNMGGDPGSLGRSIDCAAIATDYRKHKLPLLTFSHALQIAACLKGNDTGECLLTEEEWNSIVGMDKRAPTWLQLCEHRDRAVYLSSLPASVTTQKLEGMLEMEADCSINEICLMKDPVLQKNNGLAWVLMADVDSVHRALDFFNTGQAVMFGQAFTISHLEVCVDDEANDSAAAVARRDMAQRLETRRKDEQSHNALLLQSAAESKARHEYRALHPAYADGRIW